MPFTLFTVIQADDDALRPAADYLEHLFYTSHPQHRGLMARNSYTRQPASVEITAPTAASADHTTADTFNDNDGNKECDAAVVAQQDAPSPVLPARTPRVLATQEQRPVSWSSDHSQATRSPNYSRPSTSPRGLPVRSYVPSRSLNTSPVPAATAFVPSVNNLSPTATATSPSSQVRARSLPPPTTPYHHRSSPRARSPLRLVDDSTQAITMANDAGFEIIAEDSELDLSQHHNGDRTLLSSQVYSKLARNSSSRRRPASPLHGTTASVPVSSASSPGLSTTRYNEVFPSLHRSGSTSSFSSMPSTPTSMRSRSPSMSSLDTIEDAPDLESEALEAEKLVKLQAATDLLDSINTRPRTASLEASKAVTPLGAGFGRANQRKRWSVCGAERRADLDLETIWED